jgi:hypothetical protein
MATRKFREPRAFPVNDAELAAHEEMVGKLSDALWRLYKAGLA